MFSEESPDCDRLLTHCISEEKLENVLVSYGPNTVFGQDPEGSSYINIGLRILNRFATSLTQVSLLNISEHIESSFSPLFLHFCFILLILGFLSCTQLGPYTLLPGGPLAATVERTIPPVRLHFCTTFLLDI